VDIVLGIETEPPLPIDEPDPELELPELDPPLLPPDVAEPPPSPPPRGTAEPVVFPLEVLSWAAALCQLTPVTARARAKELMYLRFISHRLRRRAARTSGYGRSNRTASLGPRKTGSFQHSTPKRAAALSLQVSMASLSGDPVQSAPRTSPPVSSI
jgi:hypothetical protein